MTHLTWRLGHYDYFTGEVQMLDIRVTQQVELISDMVITKPVYSSKLTKKS